MSAAEPHRSADRRPASPDILSAALGLAAEGWPVFPCKPDKAPVVKNGFLDASADPPIIGAMFATKGAALIGVPTGEASGIDALDIDPRHAGDTWEAANLHRLPETRCHSTMNGGRHRVFRHDPRVRNSAGRIAAGVDVRGGGGYIIAPPSPGYNVVSGAPLANWPAWLLQPGLVLPPLPKERPISSAPYVPTSDARLVGFRASILAAVRRAGDGQKHITLRNAALRLGGIQGRAGFSDDEAIGWLLEALPDGVRDWGLARRTAAWGLAAGRDTPITLEERPWQRT